MFEKTSDLIFKKIYGAGRRKPDPDVLRKLMFLNPFTDAGETYRIFCTKRIRMVLICLLAGIIIFIMMKMSLLGASDIPEDGFEREEWDGSRQNVELYAITEEGKIEVDIALQPRLLAEAELDSYSEEFLNNAGILICGENPDLMNVSSDLYLAEKYDGYPFTFSWRSSDPGLISAYGGRVDTSFGEKDVLLTVKYSYGDYTGESDIPVHIIKPDISGYAALVGKITEVLKDSEQEGRNEKTWFLPGDVDGEKIVWEMRTEDNSGMILGLFLLVSILIYAAAGRDLTSQIEKRRDSIRRSYPKILRQISLYTGAGMTVKGAFMKMAADTERSGNAEPVYEEIRASCYEMNQGIGESEVYERFGRRIGLGEYIKLAGLLSQNLKRGNPDFITRLKTEADLAMKERILDARKTGEKAQTKLLAPMMMMLAVVMVMIMIPAFTGMNI